MLIGLGFFFLPHGIFVNPRTKRSQIEFFFLNNEVLRSSVAVMQSESSLFCLHDSRLYVSLVTIIIMDRNHKLKGGVKLKTNYILLMLMFSLEILRLH